MRFEDQLFLIQSRGLAAEAVWHLASGSGQVGERGNPTDLESAAGRQRILLQLQACRLLRGRDIAWPSPAEVRRLAARLAQAGVRLAWRGEMGYPARLAEALGAETPEWVWIAGSGGRLDEQSCAVIGSRQTAPKFLDAARRLGRALSEAGIVVVSGMAAGADTAAHEGARHGCAGTIAIPAMGLTHVLPLRNLECGWRNKSGSADSLCQNTESPQSQISNFKSHSAQNAKLKTLNAWTFLGMERPDAPFSAGLAIRRNDVIAALGDALVLVASGLKGGSSYGVRWALRHGVPLFCFEAGAATPPANGALLRAGQARPLGLSENEAAWATRIAAEIEKHRTARTKRRRGAGAPRPQQLDLI